MNSACVYCDREATLIQIGQNGQAFRLCDKHITHYLDEVEPIIDNACYAMELLHNGYKSLQIANILAKKEYERIKRTSNS